MLDPAMPRWMERTASSSAIPAVARRLLETTITCMVRHQQGARRAHLPSLSHLINTYLLLASYCKHGQDIESIWTYAPTCTIRYAPAPPLHLPCYPRDRDISAQPPPAKAAGGAGSNLVRTMDCRRCLPHCKGVDSQYLFLKRGASYCRRWVVVLSGSKQHAAYPAVQRDIGMEKGELERR